MEIIFCDVIGCSSPANRFMSTGEPPYERLCSYHWARLGMDAPERADMFVPIDADSQVPEAVMADRGERKPARGDEGDASPAATIPDAAPEPVRC